MRARLIGISLVALFAATAVGAIAFTSAARSSLLKSRDQVADQKANLQRAYNELDKKINDLQNQKFQVGQYLTDCDRTLRDIDRALSAQDAAYRGR